MNLQRLTGTCSDCKSSVSKKRHSKGELTKKTRERETCLKALGKRKKKSFYAHGDSLLLPTAHLN